MVSRSKPSCAGFTDWLIQRATAVIIAVYAVVIISYLATGAATSYVSWHALFSQVWMRIFTVIVLASVLWHAWIGLWTVFTDYVKPKGVRIVLQILVILLLLGYLVWLLDIFWR